MKPLEGIRVIDFTQAHAGSLCTMILSDFGAEVIKVEKPGSGDSAREWAPVKNGSSGYFTYLNRGKKSIAVNTFTGEGREILLDLMKDADVVAENFKYGNMERMGLDYDKVRAVNPEIIYASLSGYGHTGPMKNRMGIDLTLQAAGGLMERTGFPDGAPVKAGPALSEHIGGTYMALGIILALIAKKKTGKGQNIDVSIMDSLFSVLETAPITYCMTGQLHPRLGNGDAAVTPYDAFKTKDGYVAIGISADSQWEKFCDVMGMAELKKDERYKTNELRSKNYEKGLRTSIEEVMLTMSKFEVQEKLRDARLACSAVYSVEEAMETPPIKEREMLVEVYDEGIGETIQIPGTVIKMKETPGGFTEGAPLRGKHTKFYLESLGYTEEQMKSLITKKIIEVAQQEGEYR